MRALPSKRGKNDARPYLAQCANEHYLQSMSTWKEAALLLFSTASSAWLLPKAARAESNTPSHSSRIDKRFEVIEVQSFHQGEVDFNADAGSDGAAVEGRFRNHVLNALITLPQRVGKRDAFLWEVEYRRHDSSFHDLTWRGDAVPSEPARSAFGPRLRPPFDTLQMLRARWTWRHQFDSGINLLVHNRTGFYGERIELDSRWLRVGLAGGLEYRFSDTHSLGAGALVQVGVGGLQAVPFLRYQLLLPRWSVLVLLPTNASAHWEATSFVEVGVAYEANGTHYRIDRPDTRLDRVNRYFSTLGPSLRVAPLRDVFARVLVGVQPFHIFELHAGDGGSTAVSLAMAPSVQFELSYEPSYD